MILIISLIFATRRLMLYYDFFFLIEKALERDNFMSPTEAQNFGVVDHVLAQTPLILGDETNDKNEEK